MARWGPRRPSAPTWAGRFMLPAARRRDQRRKTYGFTLGKHGSQREEARLQDDTCGFDAKKPIFTLNPYVFVLNPRFFGMRTHVFALNPRFFGTRTHVFALNPHAFALNPYVLAVNARRRARLPASSCGRTRHVPRPWSAARRSTPHTPAHRRGHRPRARS